MKLVARLLTLCLVTLSGAKGVAARDPSLTHVDPSQWHGFNLLEKFTLRGDAPFREDDFKWIAELGFNFVRLPVDYRCYTEAGNWLRFREKALAEIDQAIAFGEKYQVHVCLNLHRAPGFCINPPAEPRDLWTDPLAQEAFVAHWVMFARRYRGIPPERLSFNLLNEPVRNTPESFLRVQRMAIDAIHAVDPRRIVIVDGNHAGRDACAELVECENVIQATRGYHPASISHYRASWVQGSDRWPVPVWPPTMLAGHLYGPSKADLKSPLILRGTFPARTTIALTIAQLSSSATVRLSADGVVVGELVFDPKVDPDAWRAVRSDSPWTLHEPVGRREFRVVLERPAREVSVENIAGDWVRFDQLSIAPGGTSPGITSADPSWGRKQAAHLVTADGRVLAPAGTSPDQLLIDYLEPWREIAAQGETVFVGEWGCFNRTPHAVALRWMQAWLEQWQDAHFGWALWNFRGNFGIIDSGRTDVTYEDWHGHQLDRAMLTLLQRYTAPNRAPRR